MEQEEYYYDDEDVKQLKKLQKSIFVSERNRSREQASLVSLSLTSANTRLSTYVDRKVREWRELSKSESNRGKY